MEAVLGLQIAIVKIRLVVKVSSFFILVVFGFVG